MATRAFPQNVGRLVARSTIVYTADDIRRVTTQCLADGTPCTLELGANIIAPAGFTIPGGLKAFSVDGAQRFKIIVSGDLPFLFYAKGAEDNNGCPVDIHDVEILVKAGSTLTTAFLLEQFSDVSPVDKRRPGLILSNVFVQAVDAGAINSVLLQSDFLASTFRGAIVDASNIQCRNVTHFIGDTDFLSVYAASTFTGISSTTTMSFGRGASSAPLVTCSITTMSGEIQISIGDNSIASFVSCSVDSYTGNAGTNTLLRMQAAPRTVGPNEIDLDNISGGGGGATITAATITVPFGLQEQTVTVVDASCTAASNIIVGWGSTAPTDENQPGASAVTFSAVPADGSLDVTVSSDNADPVGGAYKILYTLG
jgi:hypothetical protein